MSCQLPIPEGVSFAVWTAHARESTFGRTRCWAIDEADETGYIIGTSYRIPTPDGRDFRHEGKRGLIGVGSVKSWSGSSASDPVFVCEGASDTLALKSIGVDAVVGVASATTRECDAMLERLLAGRHAVQVKHTDKAGDELASRLRSTLGAACDSFRIITAPFGLKDAREAVGAGATREDFLARASEAQPLSSDARLSESGQAEQPFDPIPALELVRRHPQLRRVVVADLLREGEVMNVVAGPKVGKSWLTIALAVAVATGRQWLGKATTQGKVLLIDAEMHSETLSERVEATRQWLGISDDELSSLEIWPVRGRALTIEMIHERLKHLPQGHYRLIVFDALYRFMPADGDENSNAFMARIYNTLDAAAAVTGAAIVVVHHATKGSQSDKAVTDVGAGAGAQSRAADSHLILRAHEGDGAVVVDAVVRSFPPVKAFVVRAMRPGWELAPELDPLDLRKPSSRKRAGSDKPEPAPVQPWTPEHFADKVVGCLPSIKDDVLARARAAGLSASEAASLLRRALDAGLVHRHQNGHSAPHRFSTNPPEALPGTRKGEGTGAPSPPGATAPGGMGGLAYPPSPLPKRRKGRAA